MIFPSRIFFLLTLFVLLNGFVSRPHFPISRRQANQNLLSLSGGGKNLRGTSNFGKTVSQGKFLRASVVRSSSLSSGDDSESGENQSESSTRNFPAQYEDPYGLQFWKSTAAGRLEDDYEPASKRTTVESDNSEEGSIDGDSSKSQSQSVPQKVPGSTSTDGALSNSRRLFLNRSLPVLFAGSVATAWSSAQKQVAQAEGKISGAMGESSEIAEVGREGWKSLKTLKFGVPVADQLRYQVYGRGPLLDMVQRARIFKDSKQFCDLQMKYDPLTVLGHYSEWRSAIWPDEPSVY